MTFVQRLATGAERIEQHLAEMLAKYGPQKGSRLNAAMGHALLGGGKRFRPFLVIESAALFGVPTESALDAAAAFECVHCYSLAHDDLPSMDNDDLRRGRPTVHKAFDEWTAILAGDALLTLAFEIMASESAHADPVVRAQMVALLAKAAGGRGMVLGQMLDLEAEKRNEPARPSADHIRHLQALKTGALIASACEAGAVLGAASPVQRDALRTYGENLGLAFQIADDLLDAEGDAATMGKAAGKDAAAGKATLVDLIGIDNARAQLSEAVRCAEAALAQFGERASPLIQAAHFAAKREH
ncbi:polyprenyl synthetase family protein [Hyphomicrobium sulfonivorans]|uniref:polyprenyl synthetase family protein n=1 Tax=Hyphomicrobium sulfonivorans TaxID=121290 RepID=UPI00156E2615|nr:farnesyl diphosphate synthase [Hyphomicrobium sulfonivorans]MBI1648846.1 polyprenyl synthetase family protein [Hyphomicrobium sulfonivorans]NSL70619.1 geranylgeranyl pyrophosphate synthase [Hyphomicrobium sulfonivorans]